MISRLDRIIDLLRIPSVSTDPAYAKDCLRAARYLSDHLSCLGFAVRQLPGHHHPTVSASLCPQPKNPTVLIYGHYDVQPASSPSAWTTPPFQPTIRRGRIYARGATDNKCQLMIHIAAISELIDRFGAQHLPINVKFIIEGEEEIGSPSIPDQVRAFPEAFASDYLILSDTEMLGPGRPTLDINLRGVMDVEISIRTASQAAHSGQFGGLAPNPAFIMTRLLSQLKNGQGRVTLPDFYSDVVPPTAEQLRAMRQSAPTVKDVLKEGHLYFLGGGEPQLSLNRRRWYEPALDITGLSSGYTGQGTKTIIPHEASAKLSFRLVPNQDPDRIYSSLADFCQKHFPKHSVWSLFKLDTAMPYRAPADHPIYQLASNCLKTIYHRPAIQVGQGGSIGFVSTLTRTLDIPAVLIGFGLPDENLHAPNEHFSLENLYLGIQVMALFYSQLSQLKLTPRVSSHYNSAQPKS